MKTPAELKEYGAQVREAKLKLARRNAAAREILKKRRGGMIHAAIDQEALAQPSVRRALGDVYAAILSGQFANPASANASAEAASSEPTFE